MKLTRKLFALSAIAALSFGFTACGDDDSGDTGTTDKTCTSADNKCVGGTEMTCNTATGKMDTKTCSNGCGTDGRCAPEVSTETCTGDAAQCDGNKLKVCNGTNFVVTDCGTDKTCDVANRTCAEAGPACSKDEQCPATYKNACVGNRIYSTCADGCLKIAKCADGQVCDKVTGECKNECDPATFTKTCNDAGSTKACGSNGAFVIESCGAGNKCDNGSCVPDTGAAVNADSLIGKPCTGTGKITISNKELKEAMSPLVVGMLPSLGIDLPDDEVVEAPNYFVGYSDDCKALEAVKPDGMAVGCFYTSTIKFPNSIVGLTNKVKDVMASPFVASFLGKVDMNGINLDAILAAIKDLLGKGIEFKADNGYCMVADIDIDISFPEKSIVSQFIVEDKLDALVDKINTPGHDHEKAKMATCPDGSTLISFGVDEESEAGSANVGFDICLKTCAQDSDCRESDGYKCIDLPRNSAEIEAETKSAKVCFPEANITYFTKMTEDFEKLIPKKD
ncbi:MAG: hypothetical protein IJU23_03895 [Proteobacteria bacterium]|nr:hypothetical protein [Pseudomonadota bacterium]